MIAFDSPDHRPQALHLPPLQGAPEHPAGASGGAAGGARGAGGRGVGRATAGESGPWGGRAGGRVIGAARFLEAPISSGKRLQYTTGEASKPRAGQVFQEFAWGRSTFPTELESPCLVDADMKPVDCSFATCQKQKKTYEDPKRNAKIVGIYACEAHITHPTVGRTFPFDLEEMTLAAEQCLSTLDETLQTLFHSKPRPSGSSFWVIFRPYQTLRTGILIRGSLVGTMLGPTGMCFFIHLFSLSNHLRCIFVPRNPPNICEEAVSLTPFPNKPSTL